MTRLRDRRIVLENTTYLSTKLNLNQTKSTIKQHEKKSQRVTDSYDLELNLDM
ncbi:hypothetical protein HanRHA438_Chr12g0533561 [Helianthus annuus]|nr:hypothetical protein HanRHA438_Chr12g0533561 [Helianthus annuus]